MIFLCIFVLLGQYHIINQNTVPSIILSAMNFEDLKPRKIFHYDTLPDHSHTSEQQYFQQNWQIIQSTVAEYLIGQGQPPSIVKISRSLQILLIRNKYKELHEHLIRLFYEVYKSLLVTISRESNCLLSLLAYYTGKKQHYRILFDLLNAYLQVYCPNSPTPEEQAYAILCKQIFNSHLFQQIANELMAMVYRFRTTHQQNQIIELQYQLKVVTLLGIYGYCDLDVIERSKQYFIQFAQHVQKNQQIFTIIDEALSRETALNKLLKPSESSVRYLQKELIEEYYPFMIQYMDYLIAQNKLDKLKMLWSYSLFLGEAEKQLLQLRIQDIIRDVAIFIKQPNDQLYNLLPFIAKLNNIINNCFDGGKSVLNLLHHTIEQLLNDHQKNYNSVVSKKILSPTEEYSTEVIYQLFRLIPNKQRFIAELQIRFFRWILSHDVQNLLYQEQILQIIKKQCGNTLCKRMDRMISDVWKDGQMVYYHHSTYPFKCRLLCSNQWPKFSYQNITLPDSMLSILQQFELQYKKSPENSYKEIKWVNQFGVLQISINGTVSVFSECQATLILVLDKAIRPMKKDQLIEILQGNPNLIGSAIDQLHKYGVLQLNQMNLTYDINNENTNSYRVVKEQKQNVEEIKTLSKRDDTIIIEAAVVRILKKKRTMQKTDLSKTIYDYITTFKPTLQQINQALERLAIRDFIDIDKSKGNIKYKD